MIPIARALLIAGPVVVVLIVDGPIAWVGAVGIYIVVCLGVAAVAGMGR